MRVQELNFKQSFKADDTPASFLHSQAEVTASWTTTCDLITQFLGSFIPRLFVFKSNFAIINNKVKNFMKKTKQN